MKNTTLHSVRSAVCLTAISVRKIPTNTAHATLGASRFFNFGFFNFRFFSLRFFSLRFFFRNSTLLALTLSKSLRPQLVFYFVTVLFSLQALSQEESLIDKSSDQPNDQLRTQTNQQTNQQTKEVAFAAIVQFVAGRVERKLPEAQRASPASGKRDNSEPLDFRTAIYDGEKIRVAEEATLKLITKSGCIGVFYGPGEVESPTEQQPWRIRTRATRWICPSGARLNLLIRGLPLEVSGGEFLFDNGRLLILAGQVIAPRATRDTDVDFTVGTLYQYRSKRWQSLKPAPHPYEIWQFNQNQQAPQESAQLAKPDRPIQTRITLSPIRGRGSLFFDHHEIDQDVPDLSGVRLQIHRRLGTGSMTYGFSFVEKGEKESNDSENIFEGNRTTTHLAALEAGYRLYHEKSLSPYLRLGLGYQTAEIRTQRFMPYEFSRTEYEFYSLTAALGADLFILLSKASWLGLYTGAEVSLTQSLGRGAKKVREAPYTTSFPQSSATQPLEPWRLTEVSLQIMLGLVIQI